MTRQGRASLKRKWKLEKSFIVMISKVGRLDESNHVGNKILCEIPLNRLSSNSFSSLQRFLQQVQFAFRIIKSNDTFPERQALKTGRSPTM